MGELCHFLGRDFVCGIFTWPAGGQRGMLFGYDFDRESAEYAVEDLVKVIRIVGRTPGVERIHLIAHSRGTDTLASALAELSVEAYTLRSSPDREFHIGNVVLVAPDLDGDVALTKIFKVFSDPDLPFGGKADPGAVIPPSPGLRVTLYVSPDDKALTTASWLFGSIARLGRIDTTTLSADQIEAIALLRAVDIIQVRGTTDFFGHSYYISNPQVSADIIALLRYGLKPNEPGRPLEEVTRPFWRIETGVLGECSSARIANCAKPMNSCAKGRHLHRSRNSSNAACDDFLPSRIRGPRATLSVLPVVDARKTRKVTVSATDCVGRSR